MVELATLQAVSYIMGSLGVFVAAINYAFSIRESRRNQRINTTATLLQSMLSHEMMRVEGGLMEMEWKDFEDFYKKYDSSVNLENYSDRAMTWGRFNLIGFLLKRGLVDIETLYCVEGLTMINAWIKFKPIIEEYRKFSYGKDSYEHWEYLANEMAKLKDKKDPSWKYSAVDNFQPEEYDRTFKKKG